VPLLVPTGVAGGALVPVVAGEFDFRDAISTGATFIPLNVDVPPGRYWPGGVAIRTVADGAGLFGTTLVCVVTGAVTVGIAGIDAGKAVVVGFAA
jgi:hypothetical protein